MAYTVHRPLTNSHPLPSLSTLRVAALSLIQGAGDLAATWRRRARERTQLARLSDHDLHDIGLNRVDVYRETSKPFWRD
jgi:uncharacterized protein YjiS (DUF1127 family)